ncbi:MAG: MFS transporter [Candidatus Saccharibacteria bacterium]
MVKRVVHKNLVLLIVAVAQFMVVLDSSIVNVALPSIYRALHFTSPSSLQWVVTAYTLAFGGFLLLGGRAADLYGRKKMFVYAASCFSVASLLCGLSQNSTMIEVLRGVQGLAAAFMSPAALSIVLTTFKEGKERATALSVWGAVAAGGAAAGVLFGGILTEYLDWRWNFFVNVPVGIAVVIAANLYVPESKADLDHNKLDLPGAILVTSGLMLLVYTLTKAPIYGWASGHTLGFLALSASLLAGFIFNESRSRHALMPLHIFKIGNVRFANMAQLPITASAFSLFFFVSLYLQTILHYSPVRSGLSFLPVTFVIGGVSVLMQHVIGRIGYKKPLVAGPLFLALGLFLLAHMSVNGSYLVNVFPGLALMAFGLGLSFISVTIAATTGIPQKESGLASGLLNTSQQIGGSLGLAILSGISASSALTYLRDNHGSGSLGLAQAQVSGFSHALYTAIGFALLSSFVTLFFIHEHKSAQTITEAIPAAG